MKIIMIDCDAEEIRANRTLFDGVVDAVSGFVSNMNNVAGISPETLAALHEDEEEIEEGE